MSNSLTIDFVSDIACPWCAIGLKSLETAIANLKGEVAVELHFQPFELNPQMPPEGQDVGEHIAQKYGSTPEQIVQSREMIRSRGADVGFVFDMTKRSRIYNTFDAHRLLHWAEVESEEGAGKQHQLKLALLSAYFTDGMNPSDRAVLLDVVAKVGLNVERAREILSTDEYAADVREREQFFLRHGIHAVPSVIINRQHLIQGGQPTEVFERALREIANTSPLAGEVASESGG